MNYQLEKWFDILTVWIQLQSPAAFDDIDLDRAREELRTSSMWREQLDMKDVLPKVVGQRDSS